MNWQEAWGRHTDGTTPIRERPECIYLLLALTCGLQTGSMHTTALERQHTRAWPTRTTHTAQDLVSLTCITLANSNRCG